MGYGCILVQVQGTLRLVEKASPCAMCLGYRGADGTLFVKRFYSGFNRLLKVTIRDLLLLI